MAPSVSRYFKNGLAPSTQKSYAAALKRFHNFCTLFNVTTPFPVTEHLLCCFAAYLADQGQAPQTGVSYLAAVRSMQLSLGLPDPRDSSSLPILKRVQAGIKRARLQRNIPPRICLPITAKVLEQIRLTLNQSAHPEKILLWAVACTTFFGFFRLGELLLESPTTFSKSASLAWGDVTVDSQSTPTKVKIHLKTSKCNQFGKGADIILGRTHTHLCPVAALTSFMVNRGSDPGPFFTDSTGTALAKAQFVQAIREILSSVGLPQHQYAGHSFRVGAATSAAMAGIEDSTIQTLGRWHSAAFLQYIRMPKDHLASVSSTLAAQA